MQKPVAGAIPPVSKRPQAGLVPAKRKWRFSLRYWRQISNFGVSQCEKSWFVSLLERLQFLSNENLDDFLNSRNLQDALRYHPIDWAAENIPLRKGDIDWLGEISQSQDFELVQFHISKSLGRVVGFFDQESVFQVVLLDPMHNIQPAGDFNFRVRQTHIAQCEYSALISRMEFIILSNKDIETSVKTSMLSDMQNAYFEATGAAVLLTISDDYLKKLNELAAQGLAPRLGDALEVAIGELKAL